MACTTPRLGVLFLCLGLGLAVAACGDDGTTGMPDGGGDGGPALRVARIMAETANPTATGTEADYSCIGSRSAPMGGADVTFDLALEDFQTDAPVAGACLKFYPDNTTPADTCDGSALTTSAEGLVTVTAPAGAWYGYRVFGDDTLEVLDTIQVNERVPMVDGEQKTATSISVNTANIIPALLNLQRAPGSAFIAGYVYDCSADSDDEQTVWGTTARVATMDGTYVAEGSMSLEPHYRYFNGQNLPNQTQMFTNTDGLYLVINLDADAAGTQYFVEIWGAAAGDTEERVLGCERITVYPDSGTLLNVGPVRTSDGPACPGL